MRKKISFLSGVMAMALAVSLFAVPTIAKAAGTLKNPVIVKDSSMEAGQKVTYDTIYLGSYPQAEVVATEEDQYTVYPTIRNGEDYIVDADLYNKLKKATWNNDEATIDDEKYRRLKSENATYAKNEDNWSENYYRWKDTTYHYFKYQPIKWRVLKVANNEAYLLADLALDCKCYNEECKGITWAQSTLRSYLNKDFYQSAFSEEEQNAILSSEVENANNLIFGVNGGSDTTDKVFLLSESEVYTDKATAYDFVSERDTYDEAKRIKSSTYAKAMGCESYEHGDNDKDARYDGNCCYWLRTPGSDTRYATGVNYMGNVGNIGDYVSSSIYGVCPVLKINLSSYTPTYAGTVCTDGTVVKVSIGNSLQTQKITLAKIKTYSAKKLGTKNAIFSLRAKTTGDGKLSYEVTKGSSKYIEVNKKGKVILKKGCPKGSYQVTITASKTSNYKDTKKVVTITVK